MNKSIICASISAFLAACSSMDFAVDTAVESKTSPKIAVTQAGAKQNSELVFCVSNDCPKHTLKRLKPPPAPQPAQVRPQIKEESPKPERFKVHFRWGWSRLDSDGRREVESVVGTGLLKDAKHIEIAGRTDPTGPRKFNEKLAIRRAEAVKAIFVMGGVPSERISAVAQQPCCDGEISHSKAEMRDLRRTDIEITVTSK